MGRLMRIDASPAGATVVTCVCGYRAVTISHAAALRIVERHRATEHPRQATYVASKRRARGNAVGA